MILKKRFPFKKLYFLLVAILLTLIPLTFTGINIYCAESSENEIELELKDTIEEQLGSLDLSALNKFFDEYCQDKIGIFGETSLIEKIKKIINGEFSENASSVLNSLLNVAFEEVLAFLPLISSIIAIAVLGSLLVELKGSSRSLADIVHFVCFGLIIIIIMGSAGKMISLCGVVLGSMQTQMEIMFPLLLTLLTAIGGTVSVAVYQPAVALLTSSVTTIFSSV